MQLVVSLYGLRSHVPQRLCRTENSIIAAISLRILTKSISIDVTEIDLSREEDLDFEVHKEISFDENSSLLQILTSLIRSNVKLFLKDKSSGEDLAKGIFPVNGFVDGENPIFKQDVVFNTIDGSETVAEVAMALRIVEKVPDRDAFKLLPLENEDLVLIEAVVTISAPPETSFESEPDLKMNLNVVLHFHDLAVLEDHDHRRTKMQVIRLSDLREFLKREQVVILEIWRSLSDESKELFADPNFDKYHGMATLDLHDLLIPGQTELSVRVSDFFTLERLKEDNPEFAPSGQQEAQQTKSRAKEVPGLDEEEIDCVWNSESKVHLEIKLSRPLVAPWARPPKPTFTLEQIVPIGLEPLIPPEPKSSLNFKEKIKGLLINLEAVEKDAPSDLLSRLREEVRSSILGIVKERYNRPGLEEMRGDLNELYIYLNDLVENVVRDLERRGSDSKYDAKGKKTLALQYEMAGWLEDARRNYLDCVAFDPSPQIWTDYGCFCLRTEDWDTAEHCLKEAIRLDRNFSEALLPLACLLMRNGRVAARKTLEEAENSVFQELVVLSSTKDNYKTEGDEKRDPLLLATLHALRGDNSAAVALLSETELPDPIGEEDQLCSLKIQRAKIELGKLMDRGLKYFTAYSFLDYGRLLASIPEKEGREFAIDVYLHGCKMFPDNIALLTELGRLYLAKGDYSKAELSFSQATRLDPHNAKIWGLLSLAIIKSNKPERALKAVREAILLRLDDVDLKQRIASSLKENGLHLVADRLKNHIEIELKTEN